MNSINVFHPAGLGDCILDISNLYQLISSNRFTKRIKYYCNQSVRPIIEMSGLDKYLDIVYLHWPTLNLYDLISLFELRKKKRKNFILAGMNLKRVGYLKYMCSNETEFYGTLEDYPDECMNRIKPRENTYNYIEGPAKNSHRIVQNFKLFKSQGLVANCDFLIKGLDDGIISNFCSISLGLESESYIVLHTSQSGYKSKKTMNIFYWQKLLNALVKQIDKKIIIIGTSMEKMNVEEMINSIDKDKIINACGETNLYQVIDIINQSDMVLAVDGGMAHLTASLGKKLLTMFGPTNPFNVAPVGTNGIILSNPVECSPCYETKKYFNCPHDRKCLNQIEYNLIVDLVLDLLNEVQIEDKTLNNHSIKQIPDYNYLKTLI